MTLNIKLPVDAVMKARRVYWDNNSNMGLAIIAALEAMVEIGMAHPGVMEAGTWRNIIATVSPVRHPTNENVLIIRLDAGEKP